MIRNIERLPRSIYIFAALLLLAACLLISLLPRAASYSVQSAKSVLQAIPLYPGATRVYHNDPTRQFTFCEIECARVSYQAPDRAGNITSFYVQWASANSWQPWRDAPIANPLGQYYQYGLSEVKWEIWLTQWGFPWLSRRHEMQRDYLLDVTTEEKSRGITNVEVIVHRLVPMPADTPIPTLPPGPPTAVMPIAPGSTSTQQPLIPTPMPTPP